RAGIEYDPASLDDLRTLVRLVDAFSQGAAILDAKDPDAVRALVRDAYAEFERDFVRPAWERRASVVAAVRRGEVTEEALPHDIIFERPDPDAILGRIASDTLFAQRVVQETLRLRPTTPKAKRRAEADTDVAGVRIPKDAQVVLDLEKGNRDQSVFGPTAAEFDPDRVLDASVPRWGLSFGGGPHQCPGRAVGAGFPVPSTFRVDDDHVYGLVALEVQTVARRGVRPDPERPPERDLRTARFTRWLHYYVRFEGRAAAR